MGRLAKPLAAGWRLGLSSQIVLAHQRLGALVEAKLLGHFLALRLLGRKLGLRLLVRDRVVVARGG